MKRRSGFTVMMRLIGLVKPLAGFMTLAVAMGLAGHLCASFITVFGGYAALELLGFATPLRLEFIFAGVIVFAVLIFSGHGVNFAAVLQSFHRF